MVRRKAYVPRKTFVITLFTHTNKSTVNSIIRRHQLSGSVRYRPRPERTRISPADGRIKLLKKRKK